MKRYLRAYGMCRSMFCAIPSPYQGWDEEARPLMLLFLPLVGLELGIYWALAGWLCHLLALPQAVTGLALAVLPYLLSGFIHLDGFLDVTDAVGSCRSLEKRREILKDSHVGAFAVIGCCILMIAAYAFAVSGGGNVWILMLVPVVSRCCSALAVTGLKPMTTSQYANRVNQRSLLMVPAVLLCLFLAAGFLLCGTGVFVLAGCLVGYSLALLRAYRSLEGMNGDIAGFSLTIGELCAVAVYALI